MRKKKEEEEEEIKKKNKKEDLSEKLADDISEEEWMELARKQEKELREKGLYYSTKYDKNDIILLKQKGWKNFKKGKVVKVNRHKIRKKVTYNIKLDKKFKGKQLYKNVLSNRIKVYEKNEDIMEELETLIKLKNDKGSGEAMKKKFNDLCKAKEKKIKKKKKIKEEQEKVKNCRKLRKLMNERRTNNDYKFFKDMNIESQRKISTNYKQLMIFQK